MTHKRINKYNLKTEQNDNKNLAFNICVQIKYITTITDYV